MNCLKCGTPDIGTRFCRICGHERGQPVIIVESPPPTYDDRMRVPRQGRRPALALILSFFVPGAGQFYNGEAKKGAIILCIWLVSMPLAAYGIGLIGLIGAWIWGMVDAYHVASVTSLIRSRA
jgi:TM2 domain-containing membrane protein YozV